MRNPVHVDVLVPLYNNDGQPFSLSAFDELEEFFLGIADAFTRRADVEGTWKSSGGRTYLDASRAYLLSVPEGDAERVAGSIDAYVRELFA